MITQWQCTISIIEGLSWNRILSLFSIYSWYSLYLEISIIYFTSIQLKYVKTVRHTKKNHEYPARLLYRPNINNLYRKITRIILYVIIIFLLNYKKYIYVFLYFNHHHFRMFLSRKNTLLYQKYLYPITHCNRHIIRNIFKLM